MFGDGAADARLHLRRPTSCAVRAAALSGRPGAVYNVGGGERVALNEVLKIIEASPGGPLRIRREGAPEGRHERHLRRHGAARRDLGFRSRVTLAEGLAREWEWIRGQA